MGIINPCPLCHEKQQKINQLEEENASLRRRLKYQKRKEKEGFFGSSTPSSQKPVKANTEEKSKKPRGAKNGHKGYGRKALALADADHLEHVTGGIGDVCPFCGGLLEMKGHEDRSVLDSHPVKAKKIIYRLEKKWCRQCRKTFRANPPGVLPKHLYGNQLMANAVMMHYQHGIPVGRLCEQLGIDDGALLHSFHRIAKLFASVVPRLIEQYRQSLVKHADETGWRTNGKNGFAWLFATTRISIFLFKKTRSASVAREVFGVEIVAGILVVDRYSGYNKMPCKIQYCYSHLLREVENIEKEFPDQSECQAFVASLAPLLALAMGLRRQPLSDEQYYQKAAEVKTQIEALVESPAQHLAIRRVQNIFTENEGRLYHWAENREVPPDNNLAERDLRPTVIARKVSFGSQSDEGASTRSVLMTVVHTLKKQGLDVATHLKYTLDQLAKDMTRDPFDLLFPHPS